nr:hypothetical protein [Tanacetum cinerariifolium]
MEILLEPTSNKLYDRSDAYAGNPVNDIRLNLNMPDHRLSEIDEGDVILDMTDRLRMKHSGDDGEVLFTSFIWRDLVRIQGPLVRDILLEGQSREKVTTADLFFLRNMGKGTVVLEGPPKQHGGAAGGGAQIDDQEGAEMLEVIHELAYEEMVEWLTRGHVSMHEIEKS